MNKNKLLFKIIIAFAALAVIFSGIAAGSALTAASAKAAYTFNEFSGAEGPGDRIHFINVGSGDAILIESEGKYGMIDCGEDSENPRGFPDLEIEGHEQKVIDYLNTFCAVEGAVTLEFVIGTHAHSDHIGCFDTLIMEDNVTVRTAYLKRYYEDRIDDYEVESWDNKEMYNEMIAAIDARGVTLIQDLGGVVISLGAFTLTLYNTKEAEAGVKVGENENSLAILVEKGDKRIMLSGDMNNYDGDEDKVGKEVGQVDVLKLGHHGYTGSSTLGYINDLKPSFCIQTTDNACALSVLINVMLLNGAPIYSAVKMKGIILEIGETIKLYGNADAVLD